MDINNIRADFPILSEIVYGKPLVYLDNAATTQKPRCVVERIEYGYYRQNANIHRGVHYISQQATEAHEEARRCVGRYINAEFAHEILFTRGTTESINLVAFSLGELLINPGDNILLTRMEHHSNIVPWQMMAERRGATISIIETNEIGELELDTIDTLLTDRTKILSLTHCSNVLGTINPIKKIVEKAHEKGIIVVVDGAQAVAHMAIDVQDLDVDFYAFSGHKIYAPNGIGVLYGKQQWLQAMPPYHGGGEMIARVTFEKTTYNELPYKFEAGTPDYIGSTALAAALNYMEGIGLPAIFAHEDALLRYAQQQLSTIEGIRFIGQSVDKVAVLSFLVGSIHPYDMGTLLDRLGFALRTGHHCAQPLMQKYQIEGTLRASFALYNTFDEVDKLVEAIARVRQMLE